jgi:hypothetical protein
MRKKVSAGWEPENFRAAVARNLKTGTFHLIIAVDAMNNQLRQVIQYIAACAPSIRLEAVYKHGETEVLVPEMHGREIMRSASTSPPKKTLEQILESCRVTLNARD